MAVSIIIDGVNLTKKSDKVLAAIVAALRSDVNVAEYADWSTKWVGSIGERSAVKAARITVVAWEHVNTVTTHTAPSPESFAWSNLEGGHTFHETPKFSEWCKIHGF